MLNKSRVLTSLLCAVLSACGTIPGPSLDSARMQDDLSAKSGTAIYPVKLIDAGVISGQLQNASTHISTLPPVTLPDPSQPKDEYRVGVGDILGITVWGHPELAANGAAPLPVTSPDGGSGGDAASRAIGADVDPRGLQVGTDGKIYFPTIGSVAVAGKTTVEIRSLLTRQLNEKLKDPQLDVRVTQFRSQWIHLAGQVKNPGSLPVTDLNLTVVDAIARSGGTLPDADLQRVQLTRDGKPYVLDIQSTLAHGDIKQNVVLKSDDIVNVPDHNESRVFVLGEISKPQTIYMDKGRLTLADAISNANSIAPTSADPRQVFVIRHAADNPTQPVVYRLDMTQIDAILLSTEFALQPLDVVYVGTSTIAHFNRLLEQLLPTVESLYLIYSVGR